MKKIIIVGGVAGGMSAATRLRRLMDDAEIIVIEKGPYVSFANCGLPYHVSGEISERSELILQTPESLQARFNLDVRPHHEVVGIDPKEQTITVLHEGKESTESYDKLILSPGAKPFIPPIKGLEEADNVFSLRNVPDLDDIMTHLKNSDPKQAVVVGAGFIGLEMAESLALRGLEVTIVEMAPHVLPPLDEDMAAYVERELKTKNVRVITGQSATKLSDNGRLVVLDDGTEIETDIIIMSVGVQPETSLAKEAGIELGMRGGILVDEHYQTNQPNIYAVGDAIIVKQQITGEDTMIALASPANRQGRQVADVIAGLNRKNQGSIGTAIVRVFDLTAGSTGLNERMARQLDREIGVVHTVSKDHAGYFPGATNLFMKLIFDKKTGEILGVQGIGEKGIDKRIDVLATAIKGGLTVFDLPELELTYAPPFGAAKDAVNMLGYVASNVMEDLTEVVQWHELKDRTDAGAQLLDLRTDAELLMGQYKDAIHIPVDELRGRIDELDPNKEYVAACHSGLRSYIGERILKQANFKVSSLDGGFNLYNLVKPEEIIHV